MTSFTSAATGEGEGVDPWDVGAGVRVGAGSGKRFDWEAEKLKGGLGLVNVGINAERPPPVKPIVGKVVELTPKGKP